MQPNGRILYSVAWHSGNVNTPGITTTIQGEVGLAVMIVEPVDGLTTVEGEQIGFESSIRAEWKWRRDRGESTANLEAFRGWLEAGED